MEGIDIVYNVNPWISTEDRFNSVNFDGPEGMRDDISAKRRFLILKRSTKL
jgi:hypothetical protein